VQIKIGIQNTSRELVFESVETADQINDLVEKAIAGSSNTLTLKDDKGNLVMVPASALAYVEIAAEQVRQVGFVS